MRTLTLFAALLAGCGPDGDVVDRDEDDNNLQLDDNGIDDTTQLYAEFNLIADWDPDTVTIEIYGGQGDEFYCGLAETGTDDDPWLEESCVGSRYCHPCGTTGVTLALGGDPDNLIEGQQTAFPDSSYEAGVTYYVENASTYECWTWGHDPYFYIVEMLEDCSVWSGR